MLESISNYNLGKDKQTFKWNIVTLIKLFKIPPFIELFKISLSVGIFAILEKQLNMLEWDSKKSEKIIMSFPIYPVIIVRHKKPKKIIKLKTPKNIKQI